MNRKACEAEPGSLVHAAALARFDALLAGSGRSAVTRRLYGSIVRRWLDAGGVPGHLDAQACSMWLADARRADLSVNTVNGRIKALRAFYRAMATMELCAPGEADRLPALRRVPQRLPRYLDDDQVAAVLAQPDVTTWQGLRDHVLLRTLYETGLRASELAALSVGDVLGDGLLFVRRGKGGRDRYVPITQDLHALLCHWMDRRRETGAGKRLVLFVGTHGRGLSRRTIWSIVDRHARAALGRALGIGVLARAGQPWQGHYPHLLRASIATHWHQRGMPITAIAQMLGHADVATTAHYVAVDLEQLRAAVAHHPRARRSL